MKCFYSFLNQPLFRGQGRNPEKSFIGILVETILKLTDLQYYNLSYIRICLSVHVCFWNRIANRWSNQKLFTQKAFTFALRTFLDQIGSKLNYLIGFIVVKRNKYVDSILDFDLNHVQRQYQLCRKGSSECQVCYKGFK